MKNEYCHACLFEDTCRPEYNCEYLTISEDSSEEDTYKYIETRRYEYRDAWYQYTMDDIM